MQAEARGRIIEAIDQKRIVFLGNDDAGPLACSIRRGAPALDAVDGQTWQPQAEDAPPVR
jgi:hypothetical protein